MTIGVTDSRLRNPDSAVSFNRPAAAATGGTSKEVASSTSARLDDAGIEASREPVEAFSRSVRLHVGNGAENGSTMSSTSQRAASFRTIEGRSDSYNNGARRL